MAQKLAGSYGDARILLVEDNVINQEVAVELLQEVGINVDLASNGAEGVRLAAAQAYDLILMDIQMPIMDGVEATQHIRRLTGRAEVPIVALSANVFAEDITHYLNSGMNGHIAKPIVVADLYATILHFLDAKQTLRASDSPNPPVALPKADVMTRLAAIPGLKPQLGLQNLAGKEASYLRVLSKFAAKHTVETANLRLALSEADLTTAKRIAHTLKGLAGTMGATDLQASAQLLDSAIHHQQAHGEINRLSERVIAEYTALAELLLLELADVEH